ncbi:MAG: M20 family metallopeptidase [Lacrimispora celerecrescens]|uniref:M20 family metallopeptidase n=1 Tax=Lacrimispora indolis TaxID=69825 RepID=UPI0004166809|nr:M20 family metallopeptidase [[Clostridium] methoxybenzovorans]MBE7719105.1 M20 family metallopeptidase [Lacrimispora celerecrescens]
MENHQSDATFLTQALIRIDSTDPGAYEKNIGEYIFKSLSSLSIPVIKKEVLPGRYNIMAKIQGEIDDPALVYICHMDTVTIGDGWTADPFGAEIIDGKIYGRGACDMKSGLACALSAFSSIAEEAASGKTPKHSFVFIGTVDEEDFMRGVEDVIKEGWVTEKSFVLDTEPTNGQIQVAHKGRTWFEIIITGVTAHASTPWKGADAIAAMAELISSIRRKIGECPSHEDLGISTVTFGQIQGGYRPYVVPDRCKVWIDMRLVPPTDTASAVSIVEQAISEASLAVPGITASYTITGDRPYIEKDENSPLLKALKAAAEETTGKPVSVTFFPGYTDTAVIAGKLHNHNCMSYGPGDLEMAHKPDEFVPCEDILRCQEVLTRLARSILF